MRAFQRMDRRCVFQCVTNGNNDNEGGHQRSVTHVVKTATTRKSRQTGKKNSIYPVVISGK